MVRALAIFAAPRLMLAFFLQNQYPQRQAWGRIEDQYFFVLYSFVAMAGVAIFEWEMLFPDRLDFLVLSPLPLRRRQLLGAKAGALTVFLALFLFAANVFGWWMLPAVSQGRPAGLLLRHGEGSDGDGAQAVVTFAGDWPCSGGAWACPLPAAAVAGHAGRWR